MLKIFTGEDRIRAKNEIEKLLGSDYEIIDGADLGLESLSNIFHGNSLLSSERKILIRDLSENKPVFEKIPDYLNTNHQIILFALKVIYRKNCEKQKQKKTFV